MVLPASVRARHSGASLVETMVGILIGMIVIAVVYNILSVAEGYKRATVGSSDAQITGLLTQFMASRDISNGGNGIMSLGILGEGRSRPRGRCRRGPQVCPSGH